MRTTWEDKDILFSTQNMTEKKVELNCGFCTVLLKSICYGWLIPMLDFPCWDTSSVCVASTSLRVCLLYSNLALVSSSSDPALLHRVALHVVQSFASSFPDLVYVRKIWYEWLRNVSVSQFRYGLVQPSFIYKFAIYKFAIYRFTIYKFAIYKFATYKYHLKLYHL